MMESHGHGVIIGEMGGEVKERIDRILGTQDWREKFAKATCLHVETEASDHCMLVLDTQPGGRRWKRRFVFDKRWMLKEDIGKVIGEAWQEEQAGSKMFRVKCKIKNVRMNLLRWSRGSCCNARKHIE